MAICYLFGTLEPTNGQINVFVSSINNFNYKTPKEFQQKIDELELSMRQKANYPSHYQFKTSNPFTTSQECQLERDIQITNFINHGLQVVDQLINMEAISTEDQWAFRNHYFFFKNLSTFDPDLGNGIRLTSIDWGSVGAYAFQLLTGLDLPFLGGDNDDDQVFKELNDRLDAISGQLNDLSNNVRIIIDTLQRLPQEIKGIVDDAFIRQSVYDLTTHVQLLRPYLKDKLAFNANKQNVINLADQLAVDVNRIIGFTGGKMSGFALCSSGFATWAQVKTILLNDRLINPTGQTIWDQPFFQNIAQKIKELFGIADVLLIQYPQTLKQIIGGSFFDISYWNFTGNNFVRDTGPIGELPYEQFECLVLPPLSGGGSFPPGTRPKSSPKMLSKVPGALPSPPFPRPTVATGSYYLLPVLPVNFTKFPNPVLIQQAYNCFTNKILPTLEVIWTFYEAFTDFKVISDKVNSALQHP
jgi:hypothetical protein